MGQKHRRARRAIRRVTLVGVFLAVWIIALVALQQTAVRLIAHHELASRVEMLEQRYDQELEDYALLLADIDRIANDPVTQVTLLKNEFGYTKRNETPVVILHGQ